MVWPTRLLDFRGYAGRGEYWTISIIINLISRAARWTPEVFGAPKQIVGSFALLAIILLLPFHAAVTVRRLHDRGRSGWWAVLLFSALFLVGALIVRIRANDLSALTVIPFGAGLLVAVWGFVELALLSGTARANIYIDPAAKQVAIFD